MIKLLLARHASNKLAVRSERDAYVRVIWNQTINYWTSWHDQRHRTIAAVDYWGGSGPGVEYAQGSTLDSDARSNSGPACGGRHPLVWRQTLIGRKGDMYMRPRLLQWSIILPPHIHSTRKSLLLYLNHILYTPFIFKLLSSLNF
jgi:hypothetical protein